LLENQENCTAEYKAVFVVITKKRNCMNPTSPRSKKERQVMLNLKRMWVMYFNCEGTVHQ